MSNPLGEFAIEALGDRIKAVRSKSELAAIQDHIFERQKTAAGLESNVLSGLMIKALNKQRVLQGEDTPPAYAVAPESVPINTSLLTAYLKNGELEVSGLKDAEQKLYQHLMRQPYGTIEPAFEKLSNEDAQKQLRAVQDRIDELKKAPTPTKQKKVK